MRQNEQKAFFFVVLAFLIIMVPTLLFTLTDLIVKAGAPMDAVGKLFVYNLPYLTVLAFPVAFLFSTLLSSGLGALIAAGSGAVLCLSLLGG